MTGPGGPAAVRVVYRKYDGALHWHHSMQALGEDEHGVWLGALAGIETRRGYDFAVVLEQAHVLLFPREAWWTAAFNAPPRRTEVYCDVTTPPRWLAPDQVTMVDLDLDVIRRRTGEVLVDDEDEFAEHRLRYAYPPHVVDSATAATRWLVRALGDGTEPFRSAYQQWLSLVA